MCVQNTIASRVIALPIILKSNFRGVLLVLCNSSRVLAPLCYSCLHRSYIAEWTYAGIFHVAVRFQNQAQFWISCQKVRVVFIYFSKKSTNELVRPKLMFLTILAKIWWFPIIEMCKQIRVLQAYNHFVPTSGLVIRNKHTKNQFAARLRGLQQIWICGWKALGEAHPLCSAQ